MEKDIFDQSTTIIKLVFMVIFGWIISLLLFTIIAVITIRSPEIQLYSPELLTISEKYIEYINVFIQWVLRLNS